MAKICHVTSVHNRYDVRIFEKECSSLANKGYDTYLVVNDDKENEEKNGVKFISTRSQRGGFLHRLLFEDKRVYKLAKNESADIYHIHDPELLLYAKRLKRTGAKVVFDSHEFYATQIMYKEYLPYFLRKIISFLFDWYQKRIYGKIDAIVLPCTYKGINPFEKCKCDTYFVNNYPKLSEISFFDLDRVNENRICYAGALTENRGVKNLVISAGKAEVELLLAGNFSDDGLKEEISELPGFKYTKYLGQLNREDVYNMYSKTSIGMATLLNVGQYCNIDTLPTKVFEYMMVGMPVILSRTDYSIKCIEEYEFGRLVDPSDTDEIAMAIQELLSDEDTMKKMAENGKLAVKEKYNWEKEAEKLAHMYKEICCAS